MPEQTGKTRALRIRLDYHKQKDGLYWGRLLSAGIAVVISGVYGLLVLLGTFVAGGQPNDTERSGWQIWAAQQVSTGPLSRAHAHLESNCEACHTRSGPQAIASDGFRWSPEAGVADLAAACSRCHAVDSHAASAGNAPCRLIDQNCATCHQEHRGMDADLSHVLSDHCVQCHGNLQSMCRSAAGSSLITEIAEFSTATHSVAGTFRSLAKDEGRIKFDHAQHLRLGQVEADRRGGFRGDMLPPRWQGRYGTDEQGLVQLVCGDCHKLQSPAGNLAEGELNQSEALMDQEFAHFYAPIDYEEHCIACHQLTYTGQTTDMLPLPHAAPRAEIRQWLSAKLSGGKLTGHLETARERTVDNPPAEVPPDAANLEVAVAAVFERCTTCHLSEDLSDSAINALLSASQPSLIPSRWLRRGLFDHGAHRGITDCGECHVTDRSQRTPDPGEAPLDHRYVMIRGPESCVPCHRGSSSNAPQELRVERTTAGQSAVTQTGSLSPRRQRDRASAACTLCHRYHWSPPAAKP